MSLRARVLLILLATALPLLVFAGLAVFEVSAGQQESLVLSAKARNRATLDAADAELRGVVAVLQSLANGEAYRRSDLATVHALSVELLRKHDTWADIRVHDTSGHTILAANTPLGQRSLLSVEDPASYRRALETAQPSVGDVFFSPSNKGDPVVAVRYPVVHEGRVEGILSIFVRPAAFQRMLAQQQLPSDWASGIVGTDGRVIARVPFVPVGTVASKDFLRQAASASEGWYRGQTIEGADTFTAYARSNFTGWTIGFALPASLVIGGTRSAAHFMLGGLGMAVLTALVLGWWLLQGVAVPMAQLRDQAVSLGEGKAVQPVHASIAEVQLISSAMVSAARAVEDRDAALLKAQGELKQHVEELEESSAVRARLLAQVAHELRNPLAPLVSGVAMLKATSEAPSTSRKTLGMMERQLSQLSRLVHDLTDVGRIDHGKLECRKEPVDLREAVFVALDTCVSHMQEKAQTLVKEVQDEPLVITGDNQRLTQVICNLLTNASKYTPGGGAIQLRAHAEGDFAVVAVQDNGIGFDPADSSVMFEMFRRLGDESSLSPSGLGIGLAVSKALAEAHGGRIEAFSEGRGKGATFRLLVPLGGATTSIGAISARSTGSA